MTRQQSSDSFFLQDSSCFHPCPLYSVLENIFISLPCSFICLVVNPFNFLSCDFIYSLKWLPKCNISLSTSPPPPLTLFFSVVCLLTFFLQLLWADLVSVLLFLLCVCLVFVICFAGIIVCVCACFRSHFTLFTAYLLWFSSTNPQKIPFSVACLSRAIPSIT